MNRFRLLVCLLALLVFSGTACDTSETISPTTVTNPAFSRTPSSIAGKVTVAGELRKIEDLMFILRDHEGEVHLLKTNADTIVDGGLQNGDPIIVVIGETGYALSIKHDTQLPVTL